MAELTDEQKKEKIEQTKASIDKKELEMSVLKKVLKEIRKLKEKKSRRIEEKELANLESKLNQDG